MLEKGTILSGYRIDGVVGQGGMGVVYEATQLSLDRTVALKVLASHLGNDVGFRERFRREGQIQARIDHPHIITVHEAGESEHGLFLAMRLIRGPNLKDMIIARELDVGRTLRVLAPVADALDTAHASELIHRDVKPQNILVGSRDHPFLADFGLTKGASGHSLTKTGQFVGTIDYISPEQIQGGRATKKSDVYALAAVLYECLTGVVPFPRESEAAVLFAHLSDAPPLVTDERPELPPTLDAVIRRGMSKEPEKRYESPGELLQEAERAFSRRLRAALTPPGPVETPQDTGIRKAEVDVPTREVTAPESPEPVAPTAVQPPMAAPPEETRIAPEETRVPPPKETRVRPEEEASSSPPAPTRAAAQAPPQQARPDTSGPPAGVVGAPPRPAPPARERPAVRGGPLALLGAIALVACIAGFAIGSSGSGDDPVETPGNLATAGPLELSFPGGWERSANARPIPGISFRNRITLAPRDSRTESLMAGLVQASGPALLPRDFVRRLGAGAPDREDTVRLGDLESYRYRNLRPRDFDGRVTLYVAPTSGGVATVACSTGARANDDFLADCDRAAATLALNGVDAFPLGPDPDYARAIGGEIGELDSASAVGRRDLARARTPDGQGKRAADLARIYERAAQAIARIPGSPAVRDAHRGIVTTLRRLASGYGRAASAARQGSRGRYNSARADIRRREAALRRALARLEALGYKVG